jgi:hypothetical protein
VRGDIGAIGKIAGDPHFGMTFPLELYPRASTARVGVIKLGLVQCGGDNPLLRI